MNCRTVLHLGIILLALVMVASFTYAGYLLNIQVRPFSPADVRVSSHPVQPVPIVDLLKEAGQKLEKRQVEQALVDYRRVLSMNPKSVEAQLGLAGGEYQAGREDVAAREYEKALLLAPKNAAALLQLARIYSHRSSTLVQSQAGFKDYLTLKPDDAQAQLELARVLARRGAAGEAQALFSKPAVERLMTYNDWRTTVFALVKSGHSKRALPILKRLIAAHPDDWEMKLQLADLYARQNDWSSALPIYRQVMSAKPNDARVALAYGLSLMSRRNYSGALTPLAKACRAAPSSGETRLAYARALKGAGNLKAAAREFDRVIPTCNGDAAILREYADLLVERRDFRKSEKYYRAAYDKGLRDERLLQGLAGALRGNGKDREALPYLEEAYRRHPSDRLAFELAQVYRKVGRYDRALELLNKIEKRS